VNKIPYDDFGIMLFSGDLQVIRVNYGGAYIIVVDGYGNYWKITHQQKGNLAIFTRVTNVQ